jgi:hypothetical protein
MPFSVYLRFSVAMKLPVKLSGKITLGFKGQITRWSHHQRDGHFRFFIMKSEFLDSETAFEIKYKLTDTS